jgi:hypothetical protein
MTISMRFNEQFCLILSLDGFVMKTNKVFLFEGNIFDAKTLDPFTHIYSYNVG